MNPLQPYGGWLDWALSPGDQVAYEAERKVRQAELAAAYAALQLATQALRTGTATAGQAFAVAQQIYITKQQALAKLEVNSPENKRRQALWKLGAAVMVVGGVAYLVLRRPRRSNPSYETAKAEARDWFRFSSSKETIAPLLATSLVIVGTAAALTGVGTIPGIAIATPGLLYFGLDAVSDGPKSNPRSRRSIVVNPRKRRRSRRR